MKKENNIEEDMQEDVHKEPRKDIFLDKKFHITGILLLFIGFIIMLLQWILGLTIVSLIGAIYMCVTSAIIFIELFAKKRLCLTNVIGYALVSFGIMTFFIIRGADAGWGAFTTGKVGFASADNSFWQGEGNFFTRLLGNFVMCSPSVLLLTGMAVILDKWHNGTARAKNILTKTMGLMTVGVSISFVFYMNLRAEPKVFDMSRGQDDYLNNIKSDTKDSPNVLVIMMDDLGYGDTSYNARKANMTPAFNTPNIDWIAENGVDFDNFYASYSVCSPSRFAMMTGRYPYRGYADNVMYPTVNTLAPFASTRVFNGFEMGANCDGMLGDEITIAETLKKAGYATGCFGKWHLGDYGQYLPTNQGFDYFYGSHHVNDMTPFYHVEEEGGEYKIAVGTENMNQSDATKLIHNRTQKWITDKALANEKFFAYYATPWPHAPIYAGEEFSGTSGAGIYGDCVTEFDYYLGELFMTMSALGVLDDTLIVFTSDNGPALQGSTNELRGGKYSAYDGGQKVPFYMRWGNNELFRGENSGKARTVSTPSTLIDLFPTLVDVCNISDKGGIYPNSYLPSRVDREIDGVNLMPAIKDKENKTVLHSKNNPILHMKREKIYAVQYAMSREDVLKSVSGYSANANNQLGNEADYSQLPLIKNNEYLNWKYFARMKNDNPEFFDKKRTNWLICLTDDTGESYQRADVFPDIAKQSKEVMDAWSKKFKANRRGYYSSYYQK